MLSQCNLRKSFSFDLLVKKKRSINWCVQTQEAQWVILHWICFRGDMARWHYIRDNVDKDILRKMFLTKDWKKRYPLSAAFGNWKNQEESLEKREAVAIDMLDFFCNTSF